MGTTLSGSLSLEQGDGMGLVLPKKGASAGPSQTRQLGEKMSNLRLSPAPQGSGIQVVIAHQDGLGAAVNRCSPPSPHGPQSDLAWGSWHGGRRQ